MIVTIARVADPERFPEIPAIARRLMLLAPPVHAVAVTELDA